QAVRCIDQRVRLQRFAHATPGDVQLHVGLVPGRGGGELTIANAGAAPASTGETAQAGPSASAGTGTSATAPANTGPAANAAATGNANAAPAPTDAETGAGGNELTQVANIMRGHVDAVRACYQNQLTRDARLQLRVQLRFTIEPSGTVSTAS